MVLPLAGAASYAGSAGATALGLGMGKSDLDLTRDLFKLQMCQAKRLWTADWSEASIRHGESSLQSAQQHAESQALALATYYQAEKLAALGLKLARDQDSRAYEMAWRAEVRESLRDELINQNSRYNIIMLCDTVCLGCVFTLVADGSPPVGTADVMIYLYVLSMGISIMLFSISLWCSVIVVRRLHEHTASLLERKLFAQCEDLQTNWKFQLQHNLPTGPREMHLVNRAYEKWLAQYLDPLGRASIHLMSIGVVTMFVTAGLLIHMTYLIEYEVINAVPTFWAAVLVTSTTVIWLKVSEDRNEKKKLGVYDNSCLDHASPIETGPFAKITKAAEELFSTAAVGLTSAERLESLSTQELTELKRHVIPSQQLHHRLASMQKESKSRAKTRQEILQLLTTAAEELDALPEELTSRLNKMLHKIDEEDTRTAELITMMTSADQTNLDRQASAGDWSRVARMPPLSERGGRRNSNLKEPMPLHPMDAQRIPVSLVSLRRKLGEVALTTLLRIQNLSEEPLRLKSGVQLKDGKFFKSLQAHDPHHNSVCYHLYPGTEIPPRSEVVIAARSGGGWVPTSGIEGALVYTNRDESWVFKISFRSGLVKRIRTCHVKAYQDDDKLLQEEEDDDDALDTEDEDMTSKHQLEQYWTISRDILDHKANNEVEITIDQLLGDDAIKAAERSRQSTTILKAGYLHKNRSFGLRMVWQPKWFVLTPTELVFAADKTTNRKSKIALANIVVVRKGFDVVKKNVFEIQTKSAGRAPYYLSAATSHERDDWIHKISQATRGLVGGDIVETELEHTPSDATCEGGIECIESERGTEILPV